MGAEADRCEAVMEALLKELGKAFSGHAFRGGGVLALSLSACIGNMTISFTVWSKAKQLKQRPFILSLNFIFPR
jgi:hypothetical protein